MGIGGYTGFLAYQITVSAIAAHNGGFSLEWWANAIIISILIATGAVIGCCVADQIVIISTSAAGAWALVSGVGTLIGQFPYMYHKAQPIWVWWIYLAGFIVFATFAVVFQCCDKKRREN